MREEGRVISITLQFVSYKIRFKQAMDGQGSFAHTVLLSAPTASNTTHFSACLLNTCLVWFESCQKRRVQPRLQSGHQQDSEEHEEEIDAMSKSISILLREQENSRPNQ